VNLDIFWLRDESLEDSANLPDPDVLALEIAGELEAALEQFAGDRGRFEALTLNSFRSSTIDDQNPWEPRASVMVEITGQGEVRAP
jgi:hypothetical protein